MLQRPPRSPLFPYTTLFRSRRPRPPKVAANEPSWARRPARRGRAAASPAVLEAEHLLVGGEPAAEEVESNIHGQDRKSTRLNSSHLGISYAVFCLKKKKHIT